MNTRTSILAIVALAATAASLVASPALAGRASAGSVGHINVAVGRSSFTTPPPPSNGHRLRNVQTAGHVPPPSCPGGCIRKNVGQGDTIDTGDSGTPWQDVNSNLPGKGAYGN